MAILGLPFERRMVDVYPGREHESAAFRRLSPSGDVPVLADGELTLHDSQAILVYLASRYDRGRRWYPLDDAAALGRIAMWLGFAAAIARTVGVARLNDFLLGEAEVDGLRREGQALFRVLEEMLWFAEQEGQDWICSRDHPTIADIACFPDIMLSEEAGISRQDFPAIRRWTERVRRIPGFVPVPGIFPAAPLD
jgi:glutathione S-transferase